MTRCHRCGALGCSLSEHSRYATKQLPIWFVIVEPSGQLAWRWKGPMRWSKARTLAIELEQNGIAARVQRRSSAIHDRKAA